MMLAYKQVHSRSFDVFVFNYMIGLLFVSKFLLFETL